MTRYIVLIAFFSLTQTNFAQDSLAFFPIQQKTAYNLNKKQFSKGIWEPLSYAINNKVEINSYPILNIYMPNIGAKVAFGKLSSEKIKVSLTHQITYLSPWLKFWQGTGTGAIITPQINIPSLWQLDNGIIATYYLNNKNIITTNLNYSLALGDKIGENYSVDLPLVYQRFAPAFIGSNINIKNNIQGKLYKKFNYLAAVDLYLINNTKNNLFIETQGMLVYAKTNKIKYSVGSKLIYGKYPFGNAFNLLPNFNIIYTR